MEWDGTGMNCYGMGWDGTEENVPWTSLIIFHCLIGVQVKLMSNYYALLKICC